MWELAGESSEHCEQPPKFTQLPVTVVCEMTRARRCDRNDSASGLHRRRAQSA